MTTMYRPQFAVGALFKAFGVFVARTPFPNSLALVAWAGVLSTLATFCLESLAIAGPSINVINLGANSVGDLEWRVEVVPDESLFTGGEGSLVAALGFEIAGSILLDTDINDTVWAFEVPGRNPFTGTSTFGLAANDMQAFVSFGSDPVSAVTELLTFTTQGSEPTVLSWGGYEIQPGQSGGFTGSRLSQSGINFDGIAGSLSSHHEIMDCDPNSQGDLDGNGVVEFADFLILGRMFGQEVSLHSEGDIDCNGRVEFADFLVLSANFGLTLPSVESVPEPSWSIRAPLAFAAVIPWMRKRRVA